MHFYTLDIWKWVKLKWVNCLKKWVWVFYVSLLWTMRKNVHVEYSCRFKQSITIYWRQTWIHRNSIVFRRFCCNMHLFSNDYVVYADLQEKKKVALLSMLIQLCHLYQANILYTVLCEKWQILASPSVQSKPQEQCVSPSKARVISGILFNLKCSLNLLLN